MKPRFLHSFFSSVSDVGQFACRLRFSRKLFSWLAVGLLMAVLASAATHAGEPAGDFLERLRAAGYYDHAIAYLSRLDKYPGVDAELRSAVPLEIARTHIDSAINARTARERDASFALAINNLEDFLKQSSHPRLSEARSQLGRLQMVRGAQMLSGEPDEAAKLKAREQFTSAGKTFDLIVNDLREKLKEMQGARVDSAKEPEQAAQRDQYRYDFLQAQLNAGESRLEAAKTFADPPKEAKNLLEEALKTYTDLSEKYEAYIQGANAFYFRGSVQQMLGQRDKALESYTIMLEQPDADDLRESKIGATLGLVQLAMAKKPADYNEALKAGTPLVGTLRPAERQLPRAQELRLELAKAHLARRDDKDKTKAPDQKRAESDARKLLLEAKKNPGPHVPETEKLLATLGIDMSTESEVTLPAVTDDPKSFGEAMATVQTVLQNSQELESQLKTLEDNGAKPEDVAPVKESLAEMRQVGIVMLRRGLPLVTRETDLREINEARKFLAYLLFSDDRSREAVVVGEFLARAAPKTAEGLAGGLLALSSLQKLIAESESDSLPTIAKIEQIGKYLIETWPDDPQASAAQGILIRLALSRDEYEKAAADIEKLPDGPEKASFRRLQGQLKYQQAVKLRTDGDTSGASSLLDSAIEDLKSGLAGISGNLISPNDMMAALILAKAQLQTGKPNEAVATLDHEKFGPITLAGKVDSPSDLFLPELYRTQLQAIVGQMTTGEGDNQALIKRASKAMENLRQSAAGPDSEKKLVGIFVALATDIRLQLDQSTPEQKQKLVAAFQVFLKQISESTKDVATLQWVGQTLMELGEASMLPGEVKAGGQSAELLAGASETLKSLQGREGVPLTNQFLLGKSLRLLGEYSKALDEFEKLLKEKPMMLDAQKEAALAYEQWAGVLAPQFRSKAYISAMSGGRPGDDKKNVIWGWGRIAQLTQRGEQFRDQFFEARLHIAICRFLQGQATKDKAVIAKAANDITSVAALYPDLGGERRKSEFNTLLKKIQSELGEQPVGLPEVEPKIE